MLNVPIHSESITLMDIYVPNNMGTLTTRHKLQEMHTGRFRMAQKVLGHTPSTKHTKRTKHGED